MNMISDSNSVFSSNVMDQFCDDLSTSSSLSSNIDSLSSSTIDSLPTTESKKFYDINQDVKREFIDLLIIFNDVLRNGEDAIGFVNFESISKRLNELSFCMRNLSDKRNAGHKFTISAQRINEIELHLFRNYCLFSYDLERDRSVVEFMIKENNKMIKFVRNLKSNYELKNSMKYDVLDANELERKYKELEQLARDDYEARASNEVYRRFRALNEKVQTEQRQSTLTEKLMEAKMCKNELNGNLADDEEDRVHPVPNVIIKKPSKNESSFDDSCDSDLGHLENEQSLLEQQQLSKPNVDKLKKIGKIVDFIEPYNALLDIPKRVKELKDGDKLYVKRCDPYRFECIGRVRVIADKIYYVKLDQQTETNAVAVNQPIYFESPSVGSSRIKSSLLFIRKALYCFQSMTCVYMHEDVN